MSNTLESRNLTMLMDFYELTMANGYLKNGMKDKIAWFDMFFRQVPDNGGFAIMAGVRQLLDYLKNLSFTEEDIELFRKKGFDGEFLEYLRDFEFSCDIWAVPEGTPIFPANPSLRSEAPLFRLSLLRRWCFSQSTTKA